MLCFAADENFNNNIIRWSTKASICPTPETIRSPIWPAALPGPGSTHGHRPGDSTGIGPRIKPGAGPAVWGPTVGGPGLDPGQTLQTAGTAAMAYNASIPVPQPVLAEADEIFQGRQPALTVVDGRSFLVLNLSPAEARDGTSL